MLCVVLFTPCFVCLGYHQACHTPNIDDQCVFSEWFCRMCVFSKAAKVCSRWQAFPNILQEILAQQLGL